jgi:hypothetical protein
MRTHRCFLSLAASAALLVTGLACQKKLSEEAVAAQEAAKTADARVAALEQQLADIKAGKHHRGSTDQEATDHVSKSQQKAIERQLADAKRRADEKRKDAVDLASAPKPPDAPKPVIVDVPAGTQVSVRLAKELSTKDDQAGDAWSGTLSEAIVAGGRTVWPAGTAVRGVVSQSTPTGRLSSGKGGLGIKLTAIGREEVDASTYVMVGDKRGARNAKFIGGGAALGALAGILSDGKNKNDHALGGAAIGAAAGTALAAGTADTVIRIPADAPVTFTLNAPERIILKP